MTSDIKEQKEQNAKGINRRDLLKAGAVGVAGIAATGLGMGTASAKTVIPDQEKLWTNSKTGRRVAIINDALLQIGPPLARNFAKMGYDLVIGQPHKTSRLASCLESVEDQQPRRFTKHSPSSDGDAGLFATGAHRTPSRLAEGLSQRNNQRCSDTQRTLARAHLGGRKARLGHISRRAR